MHASTASACLRRLSLRVCSVSSSQAVSRVIGFSRRSFMVGSMAAGIARPSEVLYAWFSRHDAPDLPVRLPLATKDAGDSIEMAFTDHHHHADPHIEGAEHVIFRHLAKALDQLKDRGHRPASKTNFHAAVLGQNARGIFGEPSAGDVDERVEKAGGACRSHAVTVVITEQ